MSDVNFSSEIGIQQCGFVDGEYIAALEIAPRHLNIVGILHGGVISTLLDPVMARAFFEDMNDNINQTAATLEMKVNFLKSVVDGKLTAVGSVVNVTRRTAFVEAYIKDQSGALIAKSSGTMIIFQRSAPVAQ